jgi:hypothetical protein
MAANVLTETGSIMLVSFSSYWTCSDVKCGGIFCGGIDCYVHSLTLSTHTNPKSNVALHIQGVSWLVDISAGGDFLGLCDQKSSHKDVSDFGRLRSYGHFLIPVHALVWTASYEIKWNAGQVGWVGIRLVIVYCMTEQLAWFTTERQPVLRPAVAFSKTGFRHRSIQINGNFTKLTLHLYFKCIMYYAGLLFCSVYCQ